MGNMIEPQRPALVLVEAVPRPVEFDPLGCTFLDDEGYVSYGDSSGTEITALPWPEAIEVFHRWWTQRRAQAERQIEIRTRRATIREVHAMHQTYYSDGRLTPDGKLILTRAPIRTAPIPKPAPPLPAWWTGQGSEPVRCASCCYWRGRGGWCSTARRSANSAGVWRRCGSFEARTVETAQEMHVEPPPPAPLRTQRPEPIVRVRRELTRLGIMDRLAELEDLGWGNVGVRIKTGLTDREADEVFNAVERAMLDGL